MSRRTSEIDLDDEQEPKTAAPSDMVRCVSCKALVPVEDSEDFSVGAGRRARNETWCHRCTGQAADSPLRSPARVADLPFSDHAVMRGQAAVAAGAAAAPASTAKVATSSSSDLDALAAEVAQKARLVRLLREREALSAEIARLQPAPLPPPPPGGEEQSK